MATLLGPIDWGGGRTEDAHREYTITFLVRVEPGEGPPEVLQCPGLPVPGTVWLFFDSVDVWAWCRFESKVERHEPQGGERDRFFTIELTFSTKPMKRCNDFAVEDPLLEPPKISGSVSKYTEEAYYDRLGRPIRNSAHEMIRGQQVEFDASRSKVRIQMNVATFQQVALALSMIDTVNQYPLWGLPPRCVKLSDVPWQDAYYGSCYKYYQLTLEFDINIKTFDRDVLDEGSKVIYGHWGENPGTDGAAWVLDEVGGADPDPDNPNHFMRAIDRNGNITRLILNGRGYPADATIGVAVTHAEVEEVSSGFQLVALTFRTATSHGFEVGDKVNVKGVNPPQYNGEFEVSDVVSTTEFKIERFGVVESYTVYVSGGYATLGENIANAGPGNIHIEKYPENNFLLLGIPVQL